MKIWEYTNNTKNRYGRTLYQIRYIKTNTLGGWIEKTCKIPQSENIFVDSNSMIHGNVSLKGIVRVINSEIFGNTKIEDRSGIKLENSIWFNVNYFFGKTDTGFFDVDNNRFFGNGIKIDHVAEDNIIEFQIKDLRLGNAGFNVFFYKHDKNGYGIKVGCQMHSIKVWKKAYKTIGTKHNFSESDIKSGLKVLSDAEIFFKDSEKILSDYFGSNYRENGKFAKKPTLDQIFQKRS